MNILQRIERLEKVVGIANPEPQSNAQKPHTAARIAAYVDETGITLQPSLRTVNGWSQEPWATQSKYLTEWRGGPPPFAGWWSINSAKFPDDCGAWSWWDGDGWSLQIRCFAYQPADEYVAHQARYHIPAEYQADVTWRWLYPHDARVRRVIPGE